MTDYDPQATRSAILSQPAPGVREKTETVVVRESNLGWWIAGILAAAAILTVIWLLATRPAEISNADVEARAVAEAQAVQARADADRLALQAQMASGAQSADIARSDAARAQAEAARATAEARAEEARAVTALTTPAPVATPPAAKTESSAVITPTTPQP